MLSSNFVKNHTGFISTEMRNLGMERLPRILICDDDHSFHLAVKHGLKSQDTKFEIRSAHNGDEALAILKNNQIDLLLLDIQMRTPDEGLTFIPRLRETDHDLAIIMISSLTNFDTVRQAMRLGASDYVPKDFDPNDLLHTIQLVLSRRQLLQRQEQKNFENLNHQKRNLLIGNSPKTQQLRKMIDRIRLSRANVVITGETGTGKEVVARQLRSTLDDGSLAPFIAVDSATIQSSTAESQLFGHEKGAFTGADKTTKGIFEEAHGGTVYFDEIGNMPLDIQSKLLRVLQEKEITRLGSSRTISLEFRVICATNKSLENLIHSGMFKDDLFQRLNVLPITLAPLRERKEDIPALLEHFAGLQSINNDPLKFTPAAVEALSEYDWPGNIRELGNMVAFLVTMTEGTEVDLPDLPPHVRDAQTQKFRTNRDSHKKANLNETNFYDRVAQFESEILLCEYNRCGGNISRLAITLGMDRSHLYTKLKEHGVHTATRGTSR
jgi:two-component system, NtrC family, nitrogen regulation response regulator NtrX